MRSGGASAASTGRWSRRRLLESGAGGAAGLAALALIGCSSSARPSASSTTAPSGSSAAAAQPKRGGTIRAVQVGANEASPLDIHQFGGLQAIAMGGVYSGLLRNTWKEVRKFDDDLAVSWENPDPLRWVFKLRSGVKWHDGRDFTIEDALWNMRKLSSPDQKGTSQPSVQLKIIADSYSSPDATTLVMKLKMPAPYLPGLLTKEQGKFYRRDVFERNALETEYIGTGPWKLDRRAIGEGFFYSRNPNFFRPGMPYPDKLERRNVASVEAEISAMATLQIHDISSFPSLLPSQIAAITKIAGDKVVVHEIANGTSPIQVNVDKPPFNDKRVRMAAHLAIDRPANIKRAFEGVGVPGVLDVRDSGDYALSASEVASLAGYRTPKDRDRADAKALLAAAGYANGGPEFSFIARRTSLYVQSATVVAEDLKAVGFKPDFQGVEANLGTTMMTKGDYGMGTSFAAADLDPILFLTTVLASDSAHTLIKEADYTTNVAKRLQQGLMSSDTAERVQAAKDVQRYICTTDSSKFFIGGTTGFVVMAKTLKGHYPAPTTHGESYEDAWLDE